MKMRVVSIRKGRRGVALLYAVSSAFVAAGMVTLMLGVALAGDEVADTEKASTRAQFLATGAIESAKKDVQTAIANWITIPGQGAVSVAGDQASYTVRPTGFVRTLADEAGIQTIENGYEIHAQAVAGGVPAQAFRVIHSLATPLFQFAVFYDEDLEIQPGPSMSIFGRVHTNRNMHLGSNATLRLNTNYVHAIGSIFRHRKDDPTRSEGTVLVREWVSNPWSAMEPASYYTMWSKAQLAAMGITSTSGFDSNFTGGWDVDGNGSFWDMGDLLPFGPGSLVYWDEPTGYTNGTGETVQTGEHNLGEAVVPQIGSIQKFEEQSGGDYAWDPTTQTYQAVSAGTGTHSKGYYHDNAELQILVNAAGTAFTAHNGSGNDVTASVSSAVTLGTIYDARQANGGAGTTKVLKIDVGLLHASGHYPANGLLYASHYGSGTGTNAKGIQLTNGALLPSKLTVASEDPVYILGDYNVGSPSISKKGAAVIADAVNLLSNSWNGSKNSGSGLPAASNTTYNVAIIAGNTNSSLGSYSGGLENLPRFHENWTGRTCTVKGAMVNTWNSAHATAPWVYGGNRYQAPQRAYSYDTAFNSVANLPPFTPMAVAARDVVTW
jgi:ribosomal protein S9